MSELESLREKISTGVRAWYETEEGQAHKLKLRNAMKEKWRKLHKGEAALGR
jgi:hypothetical protein